jgi:hypothetical protein
MDTNNLAGSPPRTSSTPSGGIDRRHFVALGLGGIATAALPPCLALAPARGSTAAPAATSEEGIEAVIRPPTLFAGIRKPITRRADLEPRIAVLEKACGDRIAGPLTHIFRFDTPVEGFDSEIGFPVSEAVDRGEIRTHTLREMHFYSTLHIGPPETLRDAAVKIHRYMGTTGLSPELELVEVYHHHDRAQPERSRTEVMGAFLAWPEVYRAQLDRVLGGVAAASIWKGGDRLTPHTPVDERCQWVAESIARLEANSTVDQHFDILSRVALVRPPENIALMRRVYEDGGRDVEAVFHAWAARMEKAPSGGLVDPPRFDGKVLHLSKPPRDGKAYRAASSHADKRRAYCFCNLVSHATDPRIDPIFCYRAAGWSRQLWEPLLGVDFTHCEITHSILKGDDFCAWDFHLPTA